MSYADGRTDTNRQSRCLMRTDGQTHTDSGMDRQTWQGQYTLLEILQRRLVKVQVSWPQNLSSRVRFWKTNYAVIKFDINTSLLRDACCSKTVADDCHLNNLLSFSGAFAKLRKATISIVMPGRQSAYLFVRRDQLGFYLREFYEILYWKIFLKSAEKIQVSLKSPTIITITSHVDVRKLWYLAEFFLIT
jgi:hypothetical protein